MIYEIFIFGQRLMFTANRERTNFSPSPTDFDVELDAVKLKNVDSDCDAVHLQIRVTSN